MNNLEALEITEVPVEMVEPMTVQAYGKERPRTPLGQLARGRTSRTVRNNMRGIKFHAETERAPIAIVPNIRQYAKHATRSVSPPAPLKRAFGGRLTARRASRHGRHKHGRRYRSRHTRR